MKNNYLIRNVSVKDINEIVSLCDLKIAWKEPRIFEELRSFEINSQQERKKLTISYTISTNNSRYLGRATGSQKTLLHKFMALSQPRSLNTGDEIAEWQNVFPQEELRLIDWVPSNDLAWEPAMKFWRFFCCREPWD